MLLPRALTTFSLPSQPYQGSIIFSLYVIRFNFSYSSIIILIHFYVHTFYPFHILYDFIIHTTRVLSSVLYHYQFQRFQVSLSFLYHFLIQFRHYAFNSTFISYEQFLYIHQYLFRSFFHMHLLVQSRFNILHYTISVSYHSRHSFLIYYSLNLLVHLFFLTISLRVNTAFKFIFFSFLSFSLLSPSDIYLIINRVHPTRSNSVSHST